MVRWGVPNGGIGVGSAPGQDGGAVDDQITPADHAPPQREAHDARDERFFNEWEQAVLELAAILDRIDPAVSTLGRAVLG